jgi:hypothetical protein
MGVDTSMGTTRNSSWEDDRRQMSSHEGVPLGISLEKTGEQNTYPVIELVARYI